VGPNAIIQGPVILEDDVVVAPGSVVTKSVPQGAVVAGVPAKIIGKTSDLGYDIFKNESWNKEIKPYLNF
jgi:serine O-acetyltransferase